MAYEPSERYSKKLNVQVGVKQIGARGRLRYEARACFRGGKAGRVSVCSVQATGRTVRSASAKALKSLSSALARRKKAGRR